MLSVESPSLLFECRTASIFARRRCLFSPLSFISSNLAIFSLTDNSREALCHDHFLWVVPAADAPTASLGAVETSLASPSSFGPVLVLIQMSAARWTMCWGTIPERSNLALKPILCLILCPATAGNG